MCRFELDTYRRIERGDIFYVKLSESDKQSLDGMGMLLGKIRPCLIVTTDKYNKQHGQCLYTVIPLKTYVEDITKIDDEYQSYLPIKTSKDRDSLLCLNQIRTVNKVDIKDYVCTIQNKELLKQIDEYIKDLLIENKEEEPSTEMQEKYNQLATQYDELLADYNALKQQLSSNMTEVIKSQTPKSIRKNSGALQIREVKKKWGRKECQEFLTMCKDFKAEEVMVMFSIGSISTYYRVKTLCEEFVKKATV